MRRPSADWQCGREGHEYSLDYPAMTHAQLLAVHILMIILPHGDKTTSNVLQPCYLPYDSIQSPVQHVTTHTFILITSLTPIFIQHSAVLFYCNYSLLAYFLIVHIFHIYACYCCCRGLDASRTLNINTVLQLFLKNLCKLQQIIPQQNMWFQRI